MRANPLPMRRLREAGLLPARRCRLTRARIELAGDAATTLHVASYRVDAYIPRVVVLERPAQLVAWCREQQVRHGVVGGFFVRPQCVPLGQVRVAGEDRGAAEIEPPWGDVRACVHIQEDGVRIARRDELPADPSGDLLQAGPLLVLDGQRSVEDGQDVEGFSAGSHQFDSDITQGRYPRAALAVAGDRVLAVACDGRTSSDAGMTLAELADALIDLGATRALNLDGGGSASLVYHRRLRNRPREEHGVDLLGGRPIVTAIAFEPR